MSVSKKKKRHRCTNAALTIVSPLTKAEREELAKCERTIKRGLDELLETSRAFKAIRDKRLYREQFETFERYCAERWGWTRRQVNYHIASLEALEAVKRKNGNGRSHPTLYALRPIHGLTGAKLETAVAEAHKLAKQRGKKIPEHADFQRAAENLNGRHRRERYPFASGSNNGARDTLLLHGDSGKVLAGVRDNSIDALVTDPPAGIGFMGHTWDADRGGRQQWIDWLTSILTECVRVMKPGAHALVWAHPRTSHWTATAVEDAGLVVRDVITHHFGNGFPKSMNVQQAVNNGAGGARQRKPDPTRSRHEKSGEPSPAGRGLRLIKQGGSVGRASDDDRWQGWGTALKPASEHWILARKPLEGPVYQNVQTHGTGGVNIDACRIGGVDTRSPTSDARSSAGAMAGSPLGRFPANVILSHSPDCKEVGVKTIGKGQRKEGTASGGIWSESTGRPAGPVYGEETIPVYECVEACPIRIMDEQAAAGASHFFYTPKASRAEREFGVDTNDHPTVKPIELMRYLCRLITPPNGIVLDPFMGSGSTGCAAILEGFRFVGIETDVDHLKLAKSRIEEIKVHSPSQTASRVNAGNENGGDEGLAKTA